MVREESNFPVRESVGLPCPCGGGGRRMESGTSGHNRQTFGTSFRRASRTSAEVAAPLMTPGKSAVTV